MAGRAGFRQLRECCGGSLTTGLRGDVRVVKLLLSLLDRYGDSTETTGKLVDMLVEDQQILAKYLTQPQDQELTPPDEASPPVANLNPKQGADGDDGAE